MVNIYDVYNTVQVIINKENRGYLTQDEFNRLAIQAQLEIFEGYFGDKNRAGTLGENSDDYSDIARNIEEKLTFFDNVGNVTNTNGLWPYSQLSNFYRIGIVKTVPATGLPVIIDEVSHKDIAYINLSNLTAPTATQPVYTRHEGGIIVYPTLDTVSVNYIRRPRDPNIVGVVVNSMFMPSTTDPAYQNFELHPSEQHELVAKILTYAGIVIRAAEITQIGSQKEQSIKGTEG